MTSYAQRVTAGVKLGLPRTHAIKLAKLGTPQKIQDFISAMPPNFEPNGDTCYSAGEALRLNTSHCIEGAFIAALALWMGGDPPYLMDLQAKGDLDHVVAVFKRDGCWGAISKSNHLWLRWRNPVYASLRELSMSYFHEYAGIRKRNSLRTLWAYSAPFDLRRVDPKIWVTGKEPCWDIACDLDASRHYNLVTLSQAKRLRASDPIEIKANDLSEHYDPRKAQKNKEKRA